MVVPLFKALVRPILEYAYAVWNTNLRKHIDDIEKVQKKLPNLYQKFDIWIMQTGLLHLNYIV